MAPRAVSLDHYQQLQDLARRITAAVDDDEAWQLYNEADLIRRRENRENPCRATRWFHDVTAAYRARTNPAGRIKLAEAHHASGLWAEYWEVLTDPAHLLTEATFVLVVDVLVGAVLWPFIRRGIRRHDIEVHGHE